MGWPAVKGAGFRSKSEGSSPPSEGRGGGGGGGVGQGRAGRGLLKWLPALVDLGCKQVRSKKAWAWIRGSCGPGKQRP